MKVNALSYFTISHNDRVFSKASSDSLGNPTIMSVVIAKNELEKYKTFENKVVKVLVEGPSKKNPEILSGYTEDMKLVNFKGDISKVGQIVNVKITKAKTFTLEGEEVDQ